ncbi:MAG TPA: lipid-A-disaccharide synthase N-terminal domain-containing protein [Kiloniellales bacterium]|nr:lipid-A-disaccharide synthase N-terminal domain-containing protein [Kiloniellales bacterium]
MDSEKIWIIIGFVGQAFFSARFLIQWIVSERAKKSIVPTAFWLFSIGGGATLLAYSIYREDPVFIAGQGAGLLIYFRNIHFIMMHKKAEQAEPPRTV